MRPLRRPALALFMLLLVARATGADALDAGFAAPPPVARPLVWWHWINGNVTKHGIEADLTDMKHVGIAGVQMFDASIYMPPGPVRYGTDHWHEHVQHAIATADKLGLEFHLMNTPGWSASGVVASEGAVASRAASTNEGSRRGRRVFIASAWSGRRLGSSAGR